MNSNIFLRKEKADVIYIIESEFSEKATETVYGKVKRMILRDADHLKEESKTGQK